MRNDLDRFLKDIAYRFILLILTGVVITLPFWNPSAMGFRDMVSWWVIFGGGMIYIWVRTFRKG